MQYGFQGKHTHIYILHTPKKSGTKDLVFQTTHTDKMAEVGAEEPQKESRHTTDEKSPPDSGFDCEFIDQPPRRSQCPICLMVPRDPHQTPCCGKAFCKACISKIREKNQPCPTCKAEDFLNYPDKGLQQELYSSKVYCTNKFCGCDWKGELRKLDLHLNSQPKYGETMEGCKFLLLNCCYCHSDCLRGELMEHQNKECMKRPFTCPTCQEYESLYDDVMFTHQSICKCRPVDCPNKCGQLMQHQKLEEHLSSECELSEVECEFSYAGCEAKILRKDLPSHMTDNMAAHMSLLAKQNRKLTNKVAALEIENKNLAAETKNILDRSSLVPTQYIEYPWSHFVDCNNSTSPRVKSSDSWLSKPFYTNLKGPSLQLCIWNSAHTLRFKFVRRNPRNPGLHISTSIQTSMFSKSYFNKIVWYGYEQESEAVPVRGSSRNELSKNCHDTLIFCINHVEHVEHEEDFPTYLIVEFPYDSD